MLDEEKTYKIIKRQLADVQKKLQGQSQISVGVKVNDKAAKQQTHKLWDSLKEKIEKKPISIEIDYSTLGKSLKKIGNLLAESIDEYSNNIAGIYNINSFSKLPDKNPSSKKSNNMLTPKDVDIVAPKLDENFNFDKWIAELDKADQAVKAGTKTWQQYFDELKPNENGWLSMARPQKARSGLRKV